jgi:hypothetical protein
MPSAWKVANVTPLYKKGSKANPGNYRPISLTHVPCKIMESIITDNMMTMLADLNFDKHHQQHGFLRRRSTLTNLLESLESWTQILDSGEGLDIIYLDYRKAFDTVAHQRLLLKLRRVGLPTGVCSWIESFLSERKMRVSVNGEFSNWISVVSGVPQGSVLGPLLFLLYVDDLPSLVSNELKMFADDTKLWTKISNLLSSNTLQADLAKLEVWARDWLLKFNEDKCVVIHVGHSIPTEYFLNGTRLKSVTEERDLGVLISNDLKPTKQCA